MHQYDLVCQLGSQVMYSPAGYRLAQHTGMRTLASAVVLRRGIAPRLMILGGSNFGVRYDDDRIFNNDHPSQKKPSFTFEAFAASDYYRKSEAAVIKQMLVNELGVDPSKVFAETLSATTEENAEFMKIILRRRPMFTGNEKVGILTLLYHMERVLPVFRKAGLNVEPLFAENILANDDPKQIEMICQYYSTPKGGKQYDIERMRQLLTEGKSLEEMMWPYWYVTVIDGNICADGEPEEIEKRSTYSIQARDKKEAALKLHQKHEHLIGIEDYIKGPFDTLEQARKA